ncbi:MAG: 30S ribosomal protein S6 [Deltaproteobacteria bacterium]|nr:30S ribosomal protein S6 [Deltaproteobacteria bacterium]
MNHYETVIVTKPQSSTKEIDEIRSFIEKTVGKIIQHENWGSKTLASTIRGETKGTYSYFLYDAGSDKIDPLTKWLRIQPQVLRYLTVKKEK